MGWRQTVYPLLIITPSGGFTGLFVYGPPGPGAGNLIASVTAQAGTDPFGNKFQPQVSTYTVTGGHDYVTRLQLGLGLFHSSTGLENGALVSDWSIQNQVYTGEDAWIAPLIFNPGVGFGAFCYVAPSGDGTGATDAAILNTVLSLFHVVNLLPVAQAGAYACSAQLNIPNGTALQGLMPVQVDGSNPYGAGILANQAAVIISNPGAGNAAIACSNTSAAQQGGQAIRNLLLEGNGTPGGSGSIGILLHGAEGAGVIDNVVVHRFDGPNLRIQTDGGTGFVPDQWRFWRLVLSASRSSHGCQADNIPDSTFMDCLSHGNALDGWNIGSSVNTNFNGVRSEGNAGRGFNMNGFASAGEITRMTGCSTELNNGSGFRWTAGTTGGTYVLAGCTSSQDGRAAGTTAGYESTGSTCRIMAAGCQAFSDATGPTYGALEQSASFGMCFTGSRLSGLTAATHDDGSNTNALQNNSPVPF